jgi:hypothetical protein
MAEFFVWVTTRRIKEGALDDLRQARAGIYLSPARRGFWPLQTKAI